MNAIALPPALPVLPAPALTNAIRERFNARVDRRGPDECWPWMGARDRDGYGRVRIDGHMHAANRVAIYLATGAWPGPLKALHSCDFPPCCNPGHLRAGTHAENAFDRDARGRRVAPSGPNHWRARRGPGYVPPPIPDLTPEQRERFWSLVDRSGGPAACWPWRGGIRREGYGNVTIGGRTYVARRVARFLVTGEQPTSSPGCTDRGCCNPGTHGVQPLFRSYRRSVDRTGSRPAAGRAGGVEGNA